MIKRDSYLTLGVPRSADSTEIRRAFKRRALERHPDRAGPDAAGEFQSLSDAYHLLADPRRRAEYDSELRRGESSPAGPAMDLRRPSPTPASAGWPQHGFREFFGWDGGTDDPVQAIALEVALSRIEAARGVVLVLGLPASVVCPACDGWGTDAGYPCPLCGDAGILEEHEITIDVPVPAGVTSGTIIEAPLAVPGTETAVLRARIRVVESP